MDPIPGPGAKGIFFPQASETVAPLPRRNRVRNADPQKLPAKLPAGREFRRPVGGSCERVALIRKELRSEVGRFCLGRWRMRGRAARCCSDQRVPRCVRCWMRYSVASVPRIMVACEDSTPPLPCASATSQSLTCRAPHSPRNWRTASISRSSPYIPGWQ
jgi:hypothetical protein